MLQYPLNALIHHILVAHDLQRLHLLSEQEVNGIQHLNIKYRHQVTARMVSENIIRGDKNDFCILITYLKSHSDIKYLIQYWEKKCKLHLLLGTRNFYKYNV